MSVFALKNSCCKNFWKTVENPGQDCNFLFLSGFSLWVLQNLNSYFSEHCHGFAIANTYCLQKEKVGKKKVFGGSSFVVLITFFR